MLEYGQILTKSKIEIEKSALRLRRPGPALVTRVSHRLTLAAGARACDPNTTTHRKIVAGVPLEENMVLRIVASCEACTCCIGGSAEP